MEQNKKYFAFISYKREDEGWAKWFQNELENYHLPSTMNGRTDILKEIPKPFRPPENNFRPIFRDIDELKAGNLPEQIYNALKDSLNLVVICSRKLGDDENAKWVNKEIEDFIEIGNKEGRDNIKYIFPFIVDGIPHSGNEQECFPRFLRELSKEQERVGGNINEGGDVGEENRERAFVKVLAGMLPDSVSFDMLWNKYDRDKMARERKEKEEKDKLLIAQSRFVAEKASTLIDEGDSYLARLLLLAILPNDSADYPYTLEAESALRKAMQYNNAILRGHTSTVYSAAFSPDGKRIVSASEDNTVRIWDAQNGKPIGDPLEGHTSSVYSAAFSPDGKRIVSVSDDNTIRIWDFPPLEELIDETRERFKNRQLTPEERKKYYLD